MSDERKKVILIQAAALLLTLGVVSFSVFHFGMESVRNRHPSQLHSSAFRRALSGTADYLARLRDSGRAAAGKIFTQLLPGTKEKLQAKIAALFLGGDGRARDPKTGDSGAAASFSALAANRALKLAANEAAQPYGNDGTKQRSWFWPDSPSLPGSNSAPAGRPPSGAASESRNPDNPVTAGSPTGNKPARTDQPGAGGTPQTREGARQWENRAGTATGDPYGKAQDSMRAELQKNFENTAAAGAAEVREHPNLKISAPSPLSTGASPQEKLAMINGELPSTGRPAKQKKNKGTSSGSAGGTPTTGNGTVYHSTGALVDPATTKSYEDLTENERQALNAELDARLAAITATYGKIRWQVWNTCSEKAQFCETNQIAVKYLQLKLEDGALIYVGLTNTLNRWRYRAFGYTPHTGPPETQAPDPQGMTDEELNRLEEFQAELAAQRELEKVKGR